MNRRDVGHFLKKLITEWAQLFGTPEYAKLGYNQSKKFQSALDLINSTHTHTRKYKIILEVICYFL